MIHTCIFALFFASCVEGKARRTFGRVILAFEAEVLLNKLMAPCTAAFEHRPTS